MSIPAGCVPNKPKRNQIVFAGAIINQNAIALSQNLSQSYVSRILRGERMPSVPVAKRMAAALGMSLEDFLDAVAERRSEIDTQKEQVLREHSRRVHREIQDNVIRIRRGLPPIPTLPLEGLPKKTIDSQA